MESQNNNTESKQLQIKENENLLGASLSYDLKTNRFEMQSMAPTLMLIGMLGMAFMTLIKNQLTRETMTPKIVPPHGGPNA